MSNVKRRKPNSTVFGQKGSLDSKTMNKQQSINKAKSKQVELSPKQKVIISPPKASSATRRPGGQRKPSRLSPAIIHQQHQADSSLCKTSESRRHYKQESEISIIQMDQENKLQPSPGLELLHSPASMKLDDLEPSFTNFDEILNKQDKINLIQQNYKKSHLEVLQSGKGHVPSPLQKNNQSSFFFKHDESSLDGSQPLLNQVSSVPHQQNYDHLRTEAHELGDFDLFRTDDRQPLSDGELSSDIDFERIDENEDDQPIEELMYSRKHENILQDDEYQDYLTDQDQTEIAKQIRGPNRNSDVPQLLLKNMKLKRFQADVADSIDVNKDKGRIQSFLEISYKKHYPI